MDAFLIRVQGTGAADIFSRIAKKQQLEWGPVSPQAGKGTDDLL
jgi:hypothetical protein